MAVAHVNMVRLVRRHIRRQRKIINHSQAQDREHEYLLDPAAAQKRQVIETGRHKLRENKHAKEVFFQKEIEIRMGVHAEPVFTLFSVHIQSVFLIIARRRHNDGKTGIQKLLRKLQPYLIGMAFDPALGTVENQPHILAVQQRGRVDVSRAEKPFLGHIPHLGMHHTLSGEVLAQVHADSQTYQLVLLRRIILNQLPAVCRHRQKLAVVPHDHFPVRAVHGFSDLHIIDIIKDQRYDQKQKTKPQQFSVFLIKGLKTPPGAP